MKCHIRMGAIRTAVLLTISGNLGLGCTRTKPALDELVALCGVRGTDARTDSVAVVLDEMGAPAAASDLAFKILSPAGKKPAVRIDRGCVRFARGDESRVVVTSLSRAQGAILRRADSAGRDGADGIVTTQLQPFNSREAFESCGSFSALSGRTVKLHTPGGGLVFGDGVYLQDLRSPKGTARNATALGCVSGETGDELLVQTREGDEAAYLGATAWNDGRAFLDARIPAVAFKTCRTPFSGQFRDELVEGKWTLRVPAAALEGGVKKWTYCANARGCAPTTWRVLGDVADVRTTEGKAMAICISRMGRLYNPRCFVGEPWFWGSACQLEGNTCCPQENLYGE